MKILIMRILKTVIITMIDDDVENSDIDDNKEPQNFCLHPSKNIWVCLIYTLLLQFADFLCLFALFGRVFQIKFFSNATFCCCCSLY